MRIREIIVEYDRGITLKSWQQKLTARMAGDQSAPETIDEIMEMIESADPTRNKVYAQWIVKRYVAGDFAADDLDQVNLQLADYDAVKKSLTTGKDINQLTYAQLPDIIQAGKAQKAAPKFEVIPDTEVLYNGPDGQLAVPKTETASRALGSGTAWCTAYTDRDTMFDHYNSTGKLYTWRAKNGDKFQFFWGKDIQFMNSANKPMSPKDMHFYRSINPPTKKLFAKYEDEFLKTGNDSRTLDLFNVLNKSQTVWEEALAVDAVAADAAYQHAKTINGRYPAGEAIIATSAEYSYFYAMLIKEPFPAGEPAIATSDKYSYFYAMINKELFPAGEPAIATSAEYSYRYANLFKQPFPAGEAIIATDPEYSYQYAKVLGKAFPAGEKAIATSAYASYQYAKLLGKAFPAGEAAIADDIYYSYEYAVLLDKPFPAGEAAIATSPRYSYEYAKLLGKPFPAGEAAIATSPRYSYEYANMLDKPFPEGEAAIARDEWSTKKYTNEVLAYYRSPSWEQLIKDDPIKSLDYALARNQPFPAGEPAILSNDETCLGYTLSILTTHHSPSWEKLIKDDAEEAYNYAVFTKKRFPVGEPAIASALGFAKHYDKKFGTNLSQQ